MKKIINIVVAVVTCFCILSATTLSVFAETNTGVDSEGYTFSIDDNGNVYYDYAIDIHNLVTYEDLKGIQLFSVVPGTGIEYTVNYTVQEILGMAASSGVNPSDIVLGGSAAGGGVASGAVATIAGLTTGQVVLLAVLMATGIVIATEPELVQTTLNDIKHYIRHETMLELNDMYFQETWLIDSEIIADINSALSQVVTISDGVVWNYSLSISLDDFTGLTDTFPTQPIVVETQPFDALTVQFHELERSVWTTIDSSGTIIYKQEPSGRWGVDGNKYATTSQSSAGWGHEITIKNTATGSSVSFYRQKTDGTHGSPGSLSTDRWFVGEPVFINDGVKTGVEVVIGHKSNRTTFYTFDGLTSSTDDGLSWGHPLILRNTGSILDEKLVTDVTFNEDTGKWKYTYKEQGQTESETKKTVELPMEPFQWIFSSSQSTSNSTNSSALNTNTSSEPYVNDMGKIEYKPGSVEVPQIDEEQIEIPKLETETKTEVDPDTGEEKEVETNDATEISPKPDTDGPGYDIGNKVDPDNPDKEQFKDFLKLPFSITGLFDWLPVPHTSLFDIAVAIVGSIVLTLFVFKVITAFF